MNTMDPNFYTGVERDIVRGEWMQTYTGARFYPSDPLAAEIDIIDIAHATAHQGRYTGHASRFYSVAEHSVLVSYLVAPEHALAGLLHDAAEAYLADISRPVKRVLGPDNDYFKLERRVEAMIFQRFGVAGIPSEVKQADIAICALEKAALMPRAEDWGIEPPAHWVPILAYAPEAACDLFIHRFCDLTGEDRGPLFERLRRLREEDDAAFYKEMTR